MGNLCRKIIAKCLHSQKLIGHPANGNQNQKHLSSHRQIRLEVGKVKQAINVLHIYEYM